MLYAAVYKLYIYSYMSLLIEAIKVKADFHLIAYMTSIIQKFIYLPL